MLWLVQAFLPRWTSQIILTHIYRGGGGGGWFRFWPGKIKDGRTFNFLPQNNCCNSLYIYNISYMYYLALSNIKSYRNVSA